MKSVNKVLFFTLFAFIALCLTAMTGAGAIFFISAGFMVGFWFSQADMLSHPKLVCLFDCICNKCSNK